MRGFQQDAIGQQRFERRAELGVERLARLRLDALVLEGLRNTDVPAAGADPGRHVDLPHHDPPVLHGDVDLVAVKFYFHPVMSFFDLGVIEIGFRQMRDGFVHRDQNLVDLVLRRAGLQPLLTSTSTSADGLPMSIQYRRFGQRRYRSGFPLYASFVVMLATSPLTALADRVAGGGDILHAVACRPHRRQHHAGT